MVFLSRNYGLNDLNGTGKPKEICALREEPQSEDSRSARDAQADPGVPDQALSEAPAFQVVADHRAEVVHLEAGNVKKL